MNKSHLELHKEFEFLMGEAKNGGLDTSFYYLLYEGRKASLSQDEELLKKFNFEF